MSGSEELTVSIPSDVMELVRARISAGAYQSEGEIAREAMRRWWERERKQAALEAELEKGLADIRAGRTSSIEEVRERLHERYANWNAVAAASS